MNMRLKILLFWIFGVSPLSINAQTNIVWHSRGYVFSSGSHVDSTSLYINGDMQFANGDSTVSSMTVEDSRMKLTGNLINDVDRGTAGGALFASPASGHEGVVEFCGTNSQSITTSGTSVADIPSKLYNYINFPNIEINNSSHVTLDAQLAAKTRDITLSKGWLILDSDVAAPGVDGDNEVDGGQESVLAHLLVEGSIDYKKDQWAGKPANERGFIQVNLKIPGEGGQDAKSIVGFGIPFGEMYNDYFMFNTLLAPVPAGFLAEPPLFDPKTVMTAGRGYVAGIDLRGTDPSEYPILEGYEGIIDFAQRATNGYRFNRNAFADYAPANQLFGLDPSAPAYQNEVLNTSDIAVQLEAGYNYLANPYTCPLNIDRLLGNDEAQAAWGIQSDALDAKPQMRNQVWVLAPGSVAEPTENPLTSRYTYNYQVAMRTGGTYTDNDNVPGVTAIAPLQMFVVRAFSTANTITIPESERVMGTTLFLRGTSTEAMRRDDFIFEFRNVGTKTTDRVSVVLRTRDELNNNANYTNVERLGSASGADPAQGIASQVYTKDASGKPLTVQFLPLETAKRLKLFHIPPLEAQPLHILGLRLETGDKVKRMWLEDSKYNTEIEITPGMVYKTDSEPDDSHERFSIRFSEGATGIDDLQTDDTPVIHAYAQAGCIYAQGFESSAIGSMVALYDINGRLIARKVANGGTITLLEGYAPGVYIVKITGGHVQTVKLLAK